MNFRESCFFLRLLSLYFTSLEMKESIFQCYAVTEYKDFLHCFFLSTLGGSLGAQDIVTRNCFASKSYEILMNIKRVFGLLNHESFGS